MASWSDVVAAGASLPGVTESTWYGTPALKVGGKGFCRMKGDGETLVIRVADLEDKEALLAGDSRVFFTTSHYDGHPFVLVRLGRIGKRMLGELFEDAWRCRAPKKLLTSFRAETRARS